MRQYIVIITKPGIQKLTELEMIAYVLFALNMHSSGRCVCSSSDSVVVYQPRKMGVNEMSAGNSHTLVSINMTVRFVM